MSRQFEMAQSPSSIVSLSLHVFSSKRGEPVRPSCKLAVLTLIRSISQMILSTSKSGGALFREKHTTDMWSSSTLDWG